MTIEQIEAGKKWVEQTIMKLAAEYSVTIDNLEWHIGNKDFDRGILPLVIFIENKRYIEKFSEENLSDCPDSPNIRKELKTHLRKLIKPKSSQSEKKIRFCPNS